MNAHVSCHWLNQAPPRFPVPTWSRESVRPRKRSWKRPFGGSSCSGDTHQRPWQRKVTPEFLPWKRAHCVPQSKQNTFICSLTPAPVGKFLKFLIFPTYCPYITSHLLGDKFSYFTLLKTQKHERNNTKQYKTGPDLVSITIPMTLHLKATTWFRH